MPIIPAWREKVSVLIPLRGSNCLRLRGSCGRTRRKEINGHALVKQILAVKDYFDKKILFLPPRRREENASWYNWLITYRVNIYFIYFNFSIFFIELCDVTHPDFWKNANAVDLMLGTCKVVTPNPSYPHSRKKRSRKSETAFANCCCLRKSYYTMVNFGHELESFLPLIWII